MGIIYTPSAVWATTATLAEDAVDDDVAATWNGPIQTVLDRTEYLYNRNTYEYHLASYNSGTHSNSTINSTSYTTIFDAMTQFPVSGGGTLVALSTGNLVTFDMTGMVYHAGGVGYYAKAALFLQARFSPDATWYDLLESYTLWDTPDFQLPGGIGTPFRLVGSYRSPVNADNIECRIGIQTFASLYYATSIKRTFELTVKVNASGQRLAIP
jgi:hypothetical protein